MNGRRPAPKAVIAATVFSLLMVALIPSSALAVPMATITFTQTDCAGGAAGLGSLQLQGDASDLPPGASVWVEFGVIPLETGWAVYEAKPAIVLADRTVSATSELMTDLTLVGGEQVDLIVRDQNSFEVYATAMAFVVCAPPAMPTTKADCLHGGWADWAVFRNTGECLKFVRNL